MDRLFYDNLAAQGIAGQPPSKETALEILTSRAVDQLLLVDAAFAVRKHHVGMDVTVHIINNAQNGHCSEDCSYCAQARSSRAPIEGYAIKSDDEILKEAKSAYDHGAHRYCMVFAGRGPSHERVEHLARLVHEIKARYDIEVCVSPGLLDEEKARILVEAGLDRLNHNINTSARFYPQICTTHTYEDRLSTIRAARRAGLQLCSGVILGMGEEAADVIEMAFTLRELGAASIPVNFFIPIAGTRLTREPNLSPEDCLRALCLFRFVNPAAEVRIAAGRERYLRSLEPLALYPANSLFLDGYLNAKGGSRARTLQMIKDAGFTIKSDHSLDELIANESPADMVVQDDDGIYLKGLEELRPGLK